MKTVQYNFLIQLPDDKINILKSIDPQQNPYIIKGANLEWILQAYLHLRQRNNLEVILSNHFVPGCINIIHSDDLIRLKGTAKDFIVCVKGEFPWRRWAHYHIVQNQMELRQNTSFLPLWVQPGLVKRNAQRKGVTTVAYAGQTWNGNLAGSEQTWVKLFEPHGIEFVSLPTGSCHDLSNIDVLIGIRSFDTKPYNSKPPSKLINAWHANIPFIGGYDSAFTQVGTPGENYLLAKTPEEVLTAVLYLRDNPELYQQLVNNGIEKAKAYTTQSIADAWENTLTQPIQKRYEQWKLSKYEHTRFGTVSSIESFRHKTKQILKKILHR